MPMNKADAARQKLLSGLGLCAKARALTFGTPMVCESLREKSKPHLVLEASDTSAATHKKISDKCNFYQVQHVRLPVTGEELAAALPGEWPPGTLIHSAGYRVIKEKALDGSWVEL